MGWPWKDSEKTTSGPEAVDNGTAERRYAMKMLRAERAGWRNAPPPTRKDPFDQYLDKRYSAQDNADAMSPELLAEARQLPSDRFGGGLDSFDESDRDQAIKDAYYQLRGQVISRRGLTMTPTEQDFDRHRRELVQRPEYDHGKAVRGMKSHGMSVPTGRDWVNPDDYPTDRQFSVAAPRSISTEDEQAESQALEMLLQSIGLKNSGGR